MTRSSAKSSPGCSLDPTIGSLSSADFTAITAMLRESTGISLGPSKRELVLGRLGRRLRALNLQTFQQYREVLDGPSGEAERVEMINALTTNLTKFFREPHHFDCLAGEALKPFLALKPQRRLRIWSAACSSGEEAYSVAMVLNNALAGHSLIDAKILATDIDTNMVEIAQAGLYDAQRATNIPVAFRHMVTFHKSGSVEMPAALKQRITFNPLNLLSRWPMQGKFDMIFCRNVVIYFDKAVQRVLFDRLADVLNVGGWLFIGHSESLLGVTERFESRGRTIYRKLR